MQVVDHLLALRVIGIFINPVHQAVPVIRFIAIPIIWLECSTYSKSKPSSRAACSSSISSCTSVCCARNSSGTLSVSQYASPITSLPCGNGSLLHGMHRVSKLLPDEGRPDASGQIEAVGWKAYLEASPHTISSRSERRSCRDHLHCPLTGIRAKVDPHAGDAEPFSP